MRISGFGQTGPYSPRSSYNPVACAFGGVTYLGGWPDRAPLRDGVTAGDYVSALFGVFGTVAALVRRDLDGLGQVVDVAMYEAALRMTGDTIGLKTGLGVRQERAGGAWAAYPISLTFVAADGRYVEVSAQSWDEVESIVAALPAGGRPQGSPLRVEATGPVEVASAARAALERFVAGRSLVEAVEALRRAGAWCSPVNSAADLRDDEHAWARGNLVRVEEPDLGPVVIPGVVPAFARSRGSVAGWSRSKGSDNEAVLKGLLGYSDERMAEATRPGLAAVEE
jgi:crotonobetainyl-CoA:carnitine CoA-transferase CaiB-like acyl-CoA transferase